MTTNSVAVTHDTGGRVSGVAVDGDSVWFVTGGDADAAPQPGFLEQLGKDGSVLKKIALGNGFTSAGIASAFGSLWVSTGSRAEVLRLQAR